MMSKDVSLEIVHRSSIHQQVMNYGELTFRQNISPWKKTTKKVFSISRQGLPADNAAVCLLGKIPTAAAVGQFPFLIRPSIMLAFTNSCHCCLLPMWHNGTKDRDFISEGLAEYQLFFPKIWSHCALVMLSKEKEQFPIVLIPLLMLLHIARIISSVFWLFGNMRASSKIKEKSRMT